MSINKGLLAHNHAHLFTYCLFMCYNGRVEGSMACKACSIYFLPWTESLLTLVPGENQSSIVSSSASGDSFSSSWFHPCLRGWWEWNKLWLNLRNGEKLQANPRGWAGAQEPGSCLRAAPTRGSWASSFHWAVPLTCALTHSLNNYVLNAYYEPRQALCKGIEII